jgi:hypothetical protein
MPATDRVLRIEGLTVTVEVVAEAEPPVPVQVTV